MSKPLTKFVQEQYTQFSQHLISSWAIDKQHFELMKDGAVVCNSGHFDVEINVKALQEIAEKVNKNIRNFTDEYIVNGKRIYLLAEGRLINLVAAEGHPACVMDMSFSTQTLASEWVAKYKGELKPQVYDVPKEIEETVADLKLKSMNLEIDELTKEQKKYLESWEQGT